MLLKADRDKKLAALPFPANAKVRIFVTGLALCELSTGYSKINFLRHLRSHKLGLTVKRIVRRTGQTDFPIPPDTQINIDDPIFVVLEHSIPQQSIKTTVSGGSPLEEMINLRTLHGATTILDWKVPSASRARPSLLVVRDCAFYTAEMHDLQFKLLSSTGIPPNPNSFDDIGYVLGGIIKSSNVNGKLTIISRSLSGGQLVLDGVNGSGDELIYDIEFDNHCSLDLDCIAEAAPHPHGTDFFFFYDVLTEQNSSRIFELFPDPNGAGGSTIVAACNPVIMDPSEPYP